MQVLCPSCGKALHVADNAASQLKCPLCEALFEPPTSLAPPVPPASREVWQASGASTQVRCRRYLHRRRAQLAMISAALALLAVAVGGGVAFWFNLQRNNPPQPRPAAAPPVAVQKTRQNPSPVARSDPRPPAGESQPKPKPAPEPRPEVEDFTISARDPSLDGASLDTTLTVGRAVQYVADDIEASVRLRPTLVIWLIDRSSSAQTWRGEFANSFEPMYRLLARRRQAGVSPTETRLRMAVWSFGRDARPLLETPTSDIAAIREAVEHEFQASGSGPVGSEPNADDREATFAAIRTAADAYLRFWGDAHGYVILGVISDEAGEDAETLDTMLPALRREGITTHVIGAEAPFGRVSWVDPRDHGSTRRPVSASPDPLCEGPESRELECVDLEFPRVGLQSAEPILPSGFGPFALTRLCRETGGVYYACAGKAGRRLLGSGRRRARF